MRATAEWESCLSAYPNHVRNVKWFADTPNSAIKSLSAPLATSNEGYAPERLSSRDRVAANFDDIVQRLRQRFQTTAAEDRATIRTAQKTVTKSAELNLRIKNLDRAERAKSAQIESQIRRISEFERAMAAKDTALEERDSGLTEKNDELAEKSDTYQQLQEMTNKSESLKQQLRKRPATPMSSNRGRAEPHSPLTTTFNMPDDDVDYEQGNGQDVQDKQDDQPDNQYEQQAGDQLYVPASSDSS